jgi:hypothetical protein
VIAERGTATASVNASDDSFLCKGKEPLDLFCEHDSGLMNLCLMIDALEKLAGNEG